mgnify:CR=1 FL=1
MELKNKRIPDGEFAQLRQEVLAQWPTGNGVGDLREQTGVRGAVTDLDGGVDALDDLAAAADAVL